MPSLTRPTRIAIVDDDPVFLELMSDLLGDGEGYEVLTSYDWPNSQRFVAAAQPDLVILDLMMGREQSGWVVLDQLRAHPATCDVPVILCSAAVPALDQHAARLREDAVRTLSKPFDVDDLLRLVSSLVSEARPKELQAT
jgi:putative two-component system response regulator